MKCFVYDSYREWAWLSTSAIDLRRLLQFAGNHLFLNKYVAIISFDSAHFRPSEDQIQAGWTVFSGVAYSQLIQSAEQVPVAGWEELYAFSNRRTLPSGFRVFVNNFEFSLNDEDQPETKASWDQIAVVNPDACVLEGSLLHIISKDRQAIEVIEKELRKLKEAT